ncbi:MAG: tyrosine-type recombinase/integrase [Treponema sp.]|nr:tyrosine-type recombinase/integrase [Treponema sp.]
MENAGKIYGFYLLEIPSKNYKSGFYYAVKYKDPESKKWLGTKTSTYTDDRVKAEAFAITNKEEIIKKIKEHKEVLHQKSDGKEFYKMLKEYYTDNSEYLKDDSVNNKRNIIKSNRISHIGFIKNYLIPFFKENNINTIQEITRSVYSNLKIYLKEIKNKKGKKLTQNSINNYLIPLNRILQYHERNGFIDKLPYSKGTGRIKGGEGEGEGEEETNSRKPNPLPTDNLKGIFENYITTYKGKKNNRLYYMLSLIGLTTGMRDSEIGRIKRSDIKHAIKGNYHFLKAYNHKTEYYNKKGEEYRKIPLHPFVVGMLKHYIKEKNIGKDDYLFGVEKTGEDIKKKETFLHPRKYHRAILDLYRNIKFREKLNDKGEVEIPPIEELENEMSEKRIVFYSLRHTFNTLCVLYRFNDKNVNRSDAVIDYFTGHKMASKMMENYTHINSVDDKTFYDNYGNFIIDMLDKFIFTNRSEEEKKDKVLGNYVDKFFEEKKEKLLNKDGKIDYEIAIKAIEEMIDTLRPEKTTDDKNEDDYFESV